MAVAQDWELERGNEGALIWTDLGPEMARRVCENPEALGMLGVVAVAFRARARVGARAWAGARAGAGAWAGARVRARVRAGVRAWVWAGARAGS
jgi:hypothetical protein